MTEERVLIFLFNLAIHKLDYNGVKMTINKIPNRNWPVSYSSSLRGRWRASVSWSRSPGPSWRRVAGSCWRSSSECAERARSRSACPPWGWAWTGRAGACFAGKRSGWGCASGCSWAGWHHRRRSGNHRGILGSRAAGRAARGAFPAEIKAVTELQLLFEMDTFNPSNAEATFV